LSAAASDRVWFAYCDVEPCRGLTAPIISGADAVEPATELRRRRVYLPYCSAPPAYRCRCGAQLRGHDRGDEDTTPWRRH
jgi:hypothetical protein